MTETHPRNAHSLDVKKILRMAVVKSGKASCVATDCAVGEGTITHWTSDKYDACLPTDYLPIFMASTGDVSILRYLADQAGYDLVEKR